MISRLPNTIAFPTYSSQLEYADQSPGQYPPVSSSMFPTSTGFPPHHISATAASSPATEEERITAIVEKVISRVLPQLSTETVSAAVTTRPVRDQRACHYCGRLGHIRRFCRTLQNDRRQTSWDTRSSGSYNARRPSNTYSRRNRANDRRVFSDERSRSPSP